MFETRSLCAAQVGLEFAVIPPLQDAEITNLHHFSQLWIHTQTSLNEIHWWRHPVLFHYWFCSKWSFFLKLSIPFHRCPVLLSLQGTWFPLPPPPPLSQKCPYLWTSLAPGIQCQDSWPNPCSYVHLLSQLSLHAHYLLFSSCSVCHLHHPASQNTALLKVRGRTQFCSVSNLLPGRGIWYKVEGLAALSPPLRMLLLAGVRSWRGYGPYWWRKAWVCLFKCIFRAGLLVFSPIFIFYLCLGLINLLSLQVRFGWPPRESLWHYVAYSVGGGCKQ